MSTGQNIKRIRKGKKITQKELAEKSGVSEISIRQYENEKRNPKIETIQKIAKALNVDLIEILKTEESNEITSLDFTSFHYNDAITALCDIAPGMREVIANEKNKLKEKLLADYECLNGIGQREAVKRVKELTEIPRYTTPDES